MGKTLSIPVYLLVLINRCKTGLGTLKIDIQIQQLLSHHLIFTLRWRNHHKKDLNHIIKIKQKLIQIHNCTGLKTSVWITVEIAQNNKTHPKQLTKTYSCAN